MLLLLSLFGFFVFLVLNSYFNFSILFVSLNSIYNLLKILSNHPSKLSSSVKDFLNVIVLIGKLINIKTYIKIYYLYLLISFLNAVYLKYFFS